jgi:hypothetical protein
VAKLVETGQIKEIITSLEKEIIRIKLEMILMIAAQTISAYYPIAANPTRGTIPLK